MSEFAGPDQLPQTSFGRAPEAHVDVHLEGDEVVEALNAAAARLDGVNTPKEAVLRMLSVFYNALGQSILVQEDGQKPRAVQDLWR